MRPMYYFFVCFFEPLFLHNHALAYAKTLPYSSQIIIFSEPWFWSVLWCLSGEKDNVASQAHLKTGGKISYTSHYNLISNISYLIHFLAQYFVLRPKFLFFPDYILSPYILTLMHVMVVSKVIWTKFDTSNFTTRSFLMQKKPCKTQYASKELSQQTMGTFVVVVYKFSYKIHRNGFFSVSYPSPYFVLRRKVNFMNILILNSAWTWLIISKLHGRNK